MYVFVMDASQNRQLNCLMLTTEVRQEVTTTWKPVVLFLVLAYGIAWILWLPLVLGPKGLHLIRYDAYLPFFGSLGTIGPLISSFLATRYEKGRWAMPSRFLPTMQIRSWFNLLTAPVLIVFAFVIIPYMYCIAPGHKLIPLHFLVPLLAIWPNMLGGPLEEEFGWRGFLLPRLSARIGNTWATLLVGALWASWHLPLMLTPFWGSFWYFLPLVMAVAVFASLAYYATGGSILGPVIVHYVFNNCSSMLGTAFVGLPRYGNRNVNETILVSMIVVALLIIAVTRGKFGLRTTSS
jgi:membrane protease YdiL (CAAX protease family)